MFMLLSSKYFKFYATAAQLLRISCADKCCCTHLVVHEDFHDVQIDLKNPWVLGFVGEQHKLNTQQRDEDEGGSHSPHVEARLGLVGHSQLGDENPNDVQQEEKVHLES